MHYWQSALQLSIGSIFFGGVMLLLPFLASVPYATSQADEIRTSFLQWKVMRSSIRKYAAQKITVNALSGASAMALAFWLHALIMNIVALPCDPQTYSGHELFFADGCFYNTWYSTLYGLPMYLSMGLGIAFCSAVWATVALAISVWIPDKLLIISVPSCLYYLWSSHLFKALFGLNLGHPADLYNDALTWPIALRAFIVYGVCLIAAIMIYVIGLKRRAQHE